MAEFLLPIQGPFKLRYLGDPVLRQEAIAVEDPSEVPEGLIKSMLDFVKRTGARGLAAPQFGIPLQIIVVRIDNQPHVLVNPTEVQKGGVEELGEEGCFSVPNFLAQIKRLSKVKFTAYVLGTDGTICRCGHPYVAHGEDGCDFIVNPGRSMETDPDYCECTEFKSKAIRDLSLSGDPARTFLHEYDHLKGKLITDYVSRPQRRVAERTVAAYVKKIQPKGV